MTSHQAKWASDAVPEYGHRERVVLVPSRDGRDRSGFAACCLGLAPRSPALARDFIREKLREWAADELVDDVAVVASEMVTNALRYGLPGPSAPASAAPSQPVVLGLLRQGPALLCAVFDPGSDVPVVREPDYFAESGRGLHVVESLSDSWGWTTPDPSGKAVWALFSFRPDAAPEGEPSRGEPAGGHGGQAATPAPVPGSPSGSEGDPVTRLLLLLELLSGPTWLKAADRDPRSGRD